MTRQKINEMNAGLTQEQDQEVKEWALRLVFAGFMPDREIIEELECGLCPRLGIEDAELYIRRLVKRYVNEHRAEEETWQAPTDCDRLHEAGKILECRGILFRPDHKCCFSCAKAAINAEIDGLAAKRRLVGFAFYHGQDSLRAASGGEMWIGFDSVVPDAWFAMGVGMQVVSALKEVGLEVEWNLNLESRIKLRDFKWQQRRMHLANDPVRLRSARPQYDPNWEVCMRENSAN